MSDFTDRMHEIVDLAGGVSALSKQTGLSISVIRKYLNGASDPSRMRMIAMADATGVSLEWMARGEGPMMRENLLFDEDKAEEEGGTLAHAAVAVYEALHEAGKLVDPEKFEELTFAMWELDRAYKKETEMDPNDPLVKKVKKLLALSLGQ